jgi:hypothetical protein
VEEEERPVRAVEDRSNDRCGCCVDARSPGTATPRLARNPGPRSGVG